MTKAVFFDIDGTLISFKTHRMPESARRALHLLRRAGIRVFAATGRSPNDTAFLKEYFDFDGIVAFNGQYCFDKEGVIYQKPLPENALTEAIPYMEENDIACCFETAEGNVFNRVDERVRRLLDLVGMSDVEPVCGDVSALSGSVFQLTAYVTEEEEAGLMRRLPGCKALRWYPTFINVTGADGGKPVGIARVAERYGFSGNDVMVFGDGGNDIDMLRSAGIGIAMGNAPDEVKAAARYVTDEVDADGIYNALRHFGVIREEA